MVKAALAHGSVLILIEGLQQELACRHPLLWIRPSQAAPTGTLLHRGIAATTSTTPTPYLPPSGGTRVP